MYEAVKIPPLFADLVDLSKYETTGVTVGGTDFYIFSRTAGGLTLKRMEKAVKNYWPKWVDAFGKVIAQAAVLDVDAPLGGGPIKNFAMAIHSSSTIDHDFQGVLMETLGWSKKASTLEYITEHYSKFSDPTQAYIDEMVAHELGGLFFGWGISKISSPASEDLWFNYGLGMLYTREIWHQFHAENPPFLQAMIDRYENYYAKEVAVDQKLIGPDTSQDQVQRVHRIQTFGHGKSYLYLKTLRERLGRKMFDQAIRKMVTQAKGTEITYANFLVQFDRQSLEAIQTLETKFQIR